MRFTNKNKYKFSNKKNTILKGKLMKGGNAASLVNEIKNTKI